VATDNGGTPLYQFWVHDSSGWKVLRDYSTNNSYTVENLEQGSYTFAVYALDADDLAAGLWDMVYYNTLVINVGSSVSITSPAEVAAGGTLTATAQATGLTGIVYQFWYRCPDGSWHASGDYTGSNSFSFTPVEPGTYQLVVYAKDHYAPGTGDFSVHDVTTTVCM
jgi:hypothetical protein